MRPGSTPSPRDSHADAIRSVSRAMSSGLRTPSSTTLSWGWDTFFFWAASWARASARFSRYRTYARARTHQREFDLILNVLDMEGAACGLAPHQRADHHVGQARYEFADPRGRRALAAFDGEERLGCCDRYLSRLETDDGAVAAYDLVLRVDRPGLRGGRGKVRRSGKRLWSRDLSRDLHMPLLFLFLCAARDFEGGDTGARECFPLTTQYMVSA
jgi:hypothetical protein